MVRAEGAQSPSWGAQTGAPCKLRRNGERPRSAGGGGVQEFEFGNEAAEGAIS